MTMNLVYSTYTLGFLLSKICNGMTSCYHDLGSFPNNSPWSTPKRRFPPPSTPQSVNTKIFFATRKNPNIRHPIRLHPDISIPQDSDYKWNRPHIFIVHGYLNNSTMHPWQEHMKNAVLKKEDANVFFLDYGGATWALNYFQAVSDSRVAGAELARFIAFLYSKFKVHPDQIHIIGHSLGAHTAAYCGKTLKGNIGRITGLDPAKPGFENYSPQVRIHKTDAKLVDILHTDSMPFFGLGGFGISMPYGHIDIYANGGLFQPGCTLSPNISVFNLDRISINSYATFSSAFGCSHLRALWFFIEAVENDKCTFWAKQATIPQSRLPIELSMPYLPISTKVTNCSILECTALGLYTSNYPARGIFYLKTNPRPPFCQLDKETDTKMVGNHSCLNNTLK